LLIHFLNDLWFHQISNTKSAVQATATTPRILESNLIDGIYGAVGFPLVDTVHAPKRIEHVSVNSDVDNAVKHFYYAQNFHQGLAGHSELDSARSIGGDVCVLASLGFRFSITGAGSTLGVVSGADCGAGSTPYGRIHAN